MPRATARTRDIAMKTNFVVDEAPEAILCTVHLRKRHHVSEAALNQASVNLKVKTVLLKKIGSFRVHTLDQCLRLVVRDR